MPSRTVTVIVHNGHLAVAEPDLLEGTPLKLTVEIQHPKMRRRKVPPALRLRLGVKGILTRKDYYDDLS